MPETAPVIPANSLVLYKGRPARVVRVTDRLDLEIEGGETAHVRVKDVELLHPGPLLSLAELRPLPGEMHAAWEIYAGTTTTLSELADLAFGRYTPASAWAAWQFVTDGLYFSGPPGLILAATAEDVAQRQRARETQANEDRSWKEFLDRVRHAKTMPEDARFLKELETLAYGMGTRSRLLRELGKNESPENAHALLLECGVWNEQVDPYPRRLGMPQRSPDLPVPPLPEEPRRDLTHLAAFAIDDEGTDNPDDALSLDGEIFWVHVADPAALVPPGSALDLEARERGATLHLPEGAAHLFPEAMTAALGLGLQAVSPALSFGIRLGPDGEPLDLEIVPSWVRVSGLTYESANLRMDEPLFLAMEAIALLRRKRREAGGAANIDLPEAKLHVADGIVEIHPILTLRSRTVVEEAMILAGEAVAAFAAAHAIPLPYSQQDAPDQRLPMRSPSEMFAMRRMMRRSQYRASPGPHSGLGLPAYAQSTSPLRRYLDLVVHQQLRAHLRGEPLIDEAGILERIGAVDSVSGALRQAENLAERHWTLVYLLQHPGWQAEGVLVDKRGATGTVIVPEIALEARVHLQGDPPLDSILTVAVGGIHLATLDVTLVVQRIHRIEQAPAGDAA